MKSKKLIFVLFLGFVFISGCFGLKEDKKTDELTILNIAVANEMSFYMQYGNLLQLKKPQIELNVLTIPIEAQNNEKKFEEWVEGNHPDLLMLTSSQYELMAGEGKLISLEPYIREDKTNIPNMYKPVIEKIRAMGSGTLYGLTNSFGSFALYYNKDIFKQNGIPFPEGQMTWEDFFMLVKRFPKDGSNTQQMFALDWSNNGDIFTLAKWIGEAKGYSYVDTTSKQATMNSDTWKSIISNVVDLFGNANVYPSINTASNENSKTNSAIIPKNFLDGKAAMAISNSLLVTTLNNSNVEESKRVNWDIAALPIDPVNQSTGLIHVNNIFAIPKDSRNAKSAWEAISFLSSKEYAQSTLKTEYNLSVYKDIRRNDISYNKDAFYTFETYNINFYQKYPLNFERAFSLQASEEMEKVIRKEKNLDQALQDIQNTGQLLIQNTN